MRVGVRLATCLFILLPVFSTQAGEATSPILETLQAASQAAYERTARALVALECHTTALEERHYGTGVVTSPRGLLLTSTSAVPSLARSIRARFRDGTVYSADLLAVHGATETALLALRPKDGAGAEFAHLELDLGARLQPGAPLYVAGNAHHTLERDGEIYWSAGILSGRYSLALARGLEAGEVLETDAAVNPGCDGGALLDASGRLVGILSLKALRGRELGLALPAWRLAAAFARELENGEEGKGRRGGASGEGRPDEGRAELARELIRLTPSGAAERLAYELREATAAARQSVVRLRLDRRPAGSEGPAAVSSSSAVSVRQQNTVPTAVSLPEFATGVLIEPAGTVLTCASNLEGLKGEVEVELADGRRLKASVRGRHLGLDIAVLRFVETTGALPALPLPEELALRPGRLLLALGAPLGAAREPTCTLGIVSALGRLEGRAVQMDALVNAGNAGGPVVDRAGRLLGVVVQADRRKIWARNSGAGFFAPAPQIRAVLEALLEGRTSSPPAPAFLGVRPAIGGTESEGVELAEVIPDSAAWRAGLRPGDTVIALGGETVRSWPALLGILKLQSEGRELPLTCVRGGHLHELNVRLEARPDEQGFKPE